MYTLKLILKEAGYPVRRKVPHLGVLALRRHEVSGKWETQAEASS